MRRVVFLLFIFYIPFMVFAQLKLDTKVTAEVTASFGWQLDRLDPEEGQQAKDAHVVIPYFENSAPLEFIMTLRGKRSEEFGEGKYYGWIRVKNIEIVIGNENYYKKRESGNLYQNPDIGTTKNEPKHPISITWEGIEAEVRLGPYVYLNLTSSGDDFSYDKEKPIIDADVVPIDRKAQLVQAPQLSEGIGIGFRLNDHLDMIISWLSGKRWASNPNNTYGIQGIIRSKPSSYLDMFFSGIISYNFFLEKGNKGKVFIPFYGGSAVIGSRIPIKNNLYFSPYLGFVFSGRLSNFTDEVINNSNTNKILDMKVYTDFIFDWSGWGRKDKDTELPFFNNDVSVSSGASLSFYYFRNLINQINPIESKQHMVGLRVGFFEDDSDEGFIPLLGASLISNINIDLKNKLLDVGLASYVNVDVGAVQPYLGIIYTRGNIVIGDVGDQRGGADMLQVKIGLEVRHIVKYTTFTLDWASGNILLTRTNPEGAASSFRTTSPFTVGNTLGQFGRVQLMATINYTNM